MTEPQVLLAAQGLSKWFGMTRAVDDVSLQVRPGEIHALVGANGSGKSTLVKLLSGALHPDRGSVSAAVDGLAIGTVHQNLSLFGEATVRENVCGVLPHRLLSPDRESRLTTALFEQLGLAARLDTRVAELPIDEQAFVAVARAMASMTDHARAVLIVDEVTSVLRGRAAQRFAEVLRRLRERGVGIVLVSHDLDEVLDLADRVTVIVDGAVGSVQAADQLDRATLIELMTGSTVDTGSDVTTGAPAHSGVVLRASGLSSDLVHGIDLEIRAGEVLGVIGVPGSGYDQIPYLVAGAGSHRRGSVVLSGRAVASSAAFARAGGRLIPADRGRTALVAGGTVVENFMLGHRGGVARWGLRNASGERAAVTEAIARYGVKCADITAPITTLSGGNQQKLIMARCLEARPRLLVVHEPTQGVDIKARADLLAHMHHAVRDQALAVLYVCGDLDEVWDNAHRVVIVRRGRKAGEATVANSRKESVHQLLY